MVGGGRGSGVLKWTIYVGGWRKGGGVLKWTIYIGGWRKGEWCIEVEPLYWWVEEGGVVY